MPERLYRLEVDWHTSAMFPDIFSFQLVESLGVEPSSACRRFACASLPKRVHVPVVVDRFTRRLEHRFHTPHYYPEAELRIWSRLRLFLIQLPFPVRLLRLKWWRRLDSNQHIACEMALAGFGVRVFWQVERESSRTFLSFRSQTATAPTGEI